MNKIYVYTDSKSDNGKLFHGQSTSGKTLETKIERIEVTNRDELITKAILRAPKDAYVLCAYGALKTTMDSKEILDALEFIIEEQHDLDVFYLTVYSDNCTLRTDDMDYKYMTFMRTMSPHGTECIMITPKGIDRVIDLIQEDHGRGLDFYLNAASEKMMNYTSLPAMIKVDISKRTKETQLIKASECREEIIAGRPLELTKKYTGNMNLFWFFLIVIAILFVAAMILSFDTKTTATTYTIPGQQNITPVSNGNNMHPEVSAGKQKIASSLSPFAN